MTADELLVKLRSIRDTAIALGGSHDVILTHAAWRRAWPGRTHGSSCSTVVRVTDREGVYIATTLLDTTEESTHVRRQYVAAALTLLDEDRG
jgi:hypothetical protein